MKAKKQINKTHKGIPLICPFCKRGSTSDARGLWLYTGHSDFYACCPNCHHNVKLLKKVENK